MKRWLAVLLSVSFVTVVRAESEGFDRFGGLKSLWFPASGFFRTHNDGHRWWLVTPEGHAFLSIGACCVRSNADSELHTGRRPYLENIVQKYGSVDPWIALTRKRLRSWGFNTQAGWSSNEIRDLPLTIVLSFWGGPSYKGGVPDFFDPSFITGAAGVAAGCAVNKDNPYVLGYFLDNELPWAPDWRVVPSIFESYLRMPPHAAGKQRLVAFFKERYASPGDLAKTWSPPIRDWSELASIASLQPVDPTAAAADRDAFVLIVARQYFQVACQAIRAVDPNHLILGCRFVSWTVPQSVVRACGEFCDVVTLNFYEIGLLGRLVFSMTQAPDVPRVPHQLDFKPFSDIANKPFMITEFSFRAMDSGMPNTFPPPLLVQPTVLTQQHRAQKFEEHVTTWISTPWCVGYHWFQYQDEPHVGRGGDGECGNYGLVNIKDEPYAPFVDRVKEMNRRAWTLHRTSGN